MRITILAAASLVLASCTAHADRPVATAPSQQSIEGDVRYLASDALQGRAAGTMGFQQASQFVADRFSAIGLQPGGKDGTYFQPVDLLFTEFGNKDEYSLTIAGPGAPEGLVAFENYVVGVYDGVEGGSIEAPLVFVGHGFEDERYGRNDYDGVDLTGKIAVAFLGAPDFLDSEEKASAGNRRSIGMSERGAIGLISLRMQSDEDQTSFEELIEYMMHDAGATWIGPDGVPFTERENLKSYVTLDIQKSQELMAEQPIDIAAAWQQTNDPDVRIKPFDMGMTAKITYAPKQSRATSRNVIGVIPGTDPELADEYVLLTAHLDHLRPKHDAKPGEDAIYNGAMDNASGVATLIDVARRLAINPPRRSVMVIALTAEEVGLMGSSYNAHYPTVPIEKIVANVNLDMPLLTYDFTDVVAFGAERSTLFPSVKAAADAAGLALTPDPAPEEGFFTRSDHYSYVQQGIPSVYIDLGPGNDGDKELEDFLENHYHKASDEADLIDFAQAARFADLNYEVAKRIANMDGRPVWRKGDYFGMKFGGPMER